MLNSFKLFFKYARLLAVMYNKKTMNSHLYFTKQNDYISQT